MKATPVREDSEGTEGRSFVREGSGRPPADPLPWRLLLIVWLPFACGYFMSYFFRVVNAMIAPELARDVGLGPAELGLLTSAYLVVFGVFQLPLGLLLDRFGARRMNALLLFVAALGAWLFARADSLAGLALARGLIGLGVSAGLMAAMKAFVDWFPMSRLATLNGALVAMGGVGALAATRPVEIMLGISDWRGVFMIVSGITAVVALAVFLVVPEKRVSRTPENVSQLIDGVRQVFADGLFWRGSLLFMVVQGTFLSMQGLWIAPWLRDAAGFTRAQVGTALAAFAVAFILGSLSSGAISDRLSRRGFGAFTVMKVYMGLSILLFASIALGWAAAAPLPVVFAYVFCAPGGVIVYALLSRHFPGELAGRVNTAINMLAFLGGFVAQWAIGAILALWPVNGGQYAQEGYRAAFLVMLAFQTAVFAWVWVSPGTAPSAERRPDGGGTTP